MRSEFQNSEPSAKTSQRTVDPGLQREILIVSVFILFTSISFFLIQYDRMRTAGPVLDQWIQDIFAGVVPAPMQYRIALPIFMHFLELHAHLRVNQSLPLIEFLCYAFALTLLYLLFRCSHQVKSASYSHRLVLLGFFLAVTQFPILWIFPWGHPETLPTTFYLAAIVVLIVRRSHIPFAIVCLLTALLSLGQALTRADVPVVVGASVLMAAAMDIPFPRPRSHVAIMGLLCAATGTAAQLYLQFIAYPTTTYSPTTPKFQLLANLNLLHPPLHIPDFLIALLPFIVSLILLRRHHLHLESSDKLVLLILLAYLPVWGTVGLVAEVRIFVPFLFLAAPTVAKLWTAFLFNEDAGNQLVSAPLQ
jgi:hypothetical protein